MPCVWEHLKLAFWPGLMWTLFLWLGPAGRPNNFWTGRAASLVLAPLIIALGYYGYTAMLGGNLFALDLALFVSAVACGQAAALGVYRGAALGGGVEAAAVGLIVLLTIAFSTLSFIGPDLPLFEDFSEYARHGGVLRADTR